MTTKIFTMLDNITSMFQLQQIHAQMIKLALDRSTFAMDKLVAFCSIHDCGDTSYSCSILNQMSNPTNFMWNLIIRGYSQTKQPHNALTWYSKMIHSGTLPDKFTFPFVLKACSTLLDVRKGQQIHSQIVKFGPLIDSYIDSSLVYLYSSCGDLVSAKMAFVGIPDENKNTVTWNSMISGCVRNEFFVEGLEYFHQMRVECVDGFDEFGLVSVTSACANMGALVLGKWVHGLVYKSGYCEVVPLGNALIDMYGKCGSMDDAYNLFEEMGVRTVVSWSTMIDAFAMHGCGRCAIDMFTEMETAGIEPDDMVFTSVLCACSHAGLLHEGRFWFEKMSQKYLNKPKIQHYGCMVDLLGKAGLLREAYEFIVNMPIEADAATWRSMVGACLYHGDLHLAELAASQLKSLAPPYDPGDVVIISNVYSRLGRWVDVEELRRGASKKPGHSFIEVDNVVHEFGTKETSHPQIDEICLLINQLVGQFTRLGCA